MSRQQLENDIWRACDIMRRDNNCGGVMEYVEHLAWVLFLKFLDEQEDLFEQEAEYEGRNYVRIIDTGYKWSQWVPKAIGRKGENGKRGAPDWDGEELMRYVRGNLIPYLASVSGSPEREIIAGIFGDRNVIVCASPFNLKDVLEIIDQIDFLNPEDIHTVAHVYESLLRRLGHENKLAGEFYTPRPVIRFMVKVIEPQIGETIYDPACGSCGFLTEAYEYMRKRVSTTQDHEILQRRTFWGQEKKPVPALLGLINMVLHGVLAPNVIRKNTLEENIRNVTQRFDIILTNPPFGGTENEQIQSNFPVKANATELLFLEHIMKKLASRSKARCAMVVPEGTLFRGGAFSTIKADLLRDFGLFFVVSLPPGTFAPYSDVKTALLFFDRSKATNEILYYELQPGNSLKKFSKGKLISDDDFSEAESVWEMWKEYRGGQGEKPFPGPFNWVETIATLNERDFDLSARNPHRDAEKGQTSSRELISLLIENNRLMVARLEELHSKLIKPEFIG